MAGSEISSASVGLLGPVELLAGDGRPITLPKGLRALLAFLALSPGHVVPVAELVRALWDDEAADREQNLQVRIYQLRRRLAAGPATITSVGAGYRLDLPVSAVDAARFHDLARQGRRALRLGEAGQAAELLARALALWRGKALQDVAGTSQCLAQHGAALDERRLDAIEDHAEAALAAGPCDGLAASLTATLGDHPLRERLRALTMTALYRDGRQADALTLYYHGRQLLADELGIDPSRHLQEVYQQILTSDPALQPPSPATTASGGADVAAHVAAAGVGRISRAVADSDPGRSNVVPAMLPAGPRWFSGRADQLKELTALLDLAAEDAPGTARIAAITGTGGIGKTTLALHWAHHNAGRFPGGHLHANLRGYDPAGPVGSDEVVRGFLEALGVPPGAMPLTEEARASLYRRLISGRAMLIVLDNARNPAHVRPMLPASPDSIVLITSRSTMTGLAATDGAVLIPLPLLDPGQAASLLTARLGLERLAAEPAATTTITGECAGLPLALAIIAARAAANPGLTLAQIATQLSAARQDADPAAALDALDTGDDQASVRAIFSWSYHQLTDNAARVFRLLAMHPGPDISVRATASLTATALPQARRHLAELTGFSLISEHIPGRYSLHDLLRAYGTEQSLSSDFTAELHEASGRVIDHYVNAAVTASGLLLPYLARFLGTYAAKARQGVTSEPIDGRPDAMAWFRAERGVLLRVIRWAADKHMDQEVVRLRTSFEGYPGLRHIPAADDAMLTAAERLGDNQALSDAHYALGTTAIQQDANELAIEHYSHALAHAEALRDRRRQAMAIAGLGTAHAELGRAAEAVAYSMRALDLAKTSGDAAWPYYLCNLGIHKAQAGDRKGGLADCIDAVQLLRAQDHYFELLGSMMQLGICYQLNDENADAINTLSEALQLAREADAAYEEAYILMWLGDAHLAVGEADAARQAWQSALTIHGRFQDHPDAKRIRSRLKQLN